MGEGKAVAVPESRGLANDRSAAEITIRQRRSARRVAASAGTWLLHGCAAAAGYNAAHHYADVEDSAC